MGLYEKVYVGLCTTGASFRIKKARLFVEDNLISYRTRPFGHATLVYLAQGVKGYPYKRTRLFFHDFEQKSIAGLGKNTGVIPDNLERKIDILSQNKLWKFIGGRSADLWETLIYMGAGYGFLRLVEFLITNLFGAK